MTLKYKANKVYISYFIIALIICLGLNHDIIKDYSFLDAYEFIYTAGRDNNFQNIFIEHGRPLLGVWCDFLYGTVFETISQLKWARLLATFFSVLFSTQIFSFLLKIGFKVYESVIFSILVLALPTFTVYYAWSATAQIPILLVLNFYAGQLLLEGFRQEKFLSLNLFKAFIIVFVSLFMYQSAVTVFLLPFVFKSVKANTFNHKTSVYYIIFTLACFLLYFVCFKLVININGLEASHRTSLSIFDLPVKVVKFFITELRILIKNSGFLIIPKISLLVGLVTFIGFYVLNYFKNKSLLFISVLVFVLLFAYAPNILSGQSYFSLRTIAPAAIIVLFYQFYFLRFLYLKYKNTRFILLIIPLVLLLFSSVNQKKYVAGLQNKEYEILKAEIELFDISSIKKIDIIRPRYGFLQKQGYLKNGFSGEFGNLSSTKDWVPNHLFCQIKWEQQQNAKGKPFEVFPVKNINVYTNEKHKEFKERTSINLIKLFNDFYKNE